MTESMREPSIVTVVAPVSDRVVYLEFSDSVRGHVDLAPWLVGPVFEEIAKSDDAFEAVFVDEFGSIAWPNGSDLDADVLRLSLVPLPLSKISKESFAIFTEVFTSVVDVERGTWAPLKVSRVRAFGEPILHVPDDLSGLVLAEDEAQ